MDPVTISSVAEYLKYIEGFDTDATPAALFRGQREDKPLMPRIARLTLKGRETAEAAMLAQFTRRARPFLQFEFTPIDDWDWLAIAQHNGMPTRLLDWTTNPLAALWFAVEKPPKRYECSKPNNCAISGGPAVVWALTPREEQFAKLIDKPGPYSGRAFDLDPLSVTTTKVLQPRYADRRIIVQAGLFTVHERGPEIVNNGFSPLEGSLEYRPLIHKVLITESMFPKIRGELDRCGVHSASMFPDLPGLCSHIASLNSLLADVQGLTYQIRS